MINDEYEIGIKKHSKTIWLELCTVCGKKHKWMLGKCCSCGKNIIPILVSDNACGAGMEECEGCFSYRDHF